MGYVSLVLDEEQRLVAEALPQPSLREGCVFCVNRIIRPGARLKKIIRFKLAVLRCFLLRSGPPIAGPNEGDIRMLLIPVFYAMTVGAIGAVGFVVCELFSLLGDD